MTDTDTETDGRTGDERPSVLAVDDRERVARSFEIWLGDSYDVATALDGETALELVDGTTDVVLLDRHMPGLSGDEVLTTIRERGFGCRVAMVTGVNPDFDILEMPFDEYLQKPLDETELRETVARLVRLRAFDDEVEELYALSRKRATLEAAKSSATLEANPEYVALCERQTELAAELDDAVAAADTETLGTLLPDGSERPDERRDDSGGSGPDGLSG
ncbi:response regulator [Halobaculum sp. MBLA0143]|uniref:response regulator n=1 Tax=Halobaculum sp. MBLA0143 TaxID=3079933 RepID=UPI0035255C93